MSRLPLAAVFLILFGQSLFADQNLFNIRDFGASGIAADDATPAVKRAIAECHRSGGGIVYVPAGHYRCLPIVLYDNMTLQIDAGAVFLVDLQNPGFQSNSFISARGAKNITIEGMGTIDGQAKYVWDDYRNDDIEIAKEVEIARQARLEMKRSYRVGKVAYMLYFQDCDNLRIEGITLQNSSAWCTRIRRCDRVTVRDATIKSDLKMGVNSDGIDIDGSKNVHIYGCNISSGDDAICIKTTAQDYLSSNHVDVPLGTSYPSENIVVDNCVLTSSSTAMMIGTETCSDIRHVIFSNCVIRNSNKGFGINVQDGGTVSDVLFANITMDLQRRNWHWWGDAEAFYFVLKKRLPDSKIGAINNVSIDHVIAHAQGTGKIISTTGQPLENISIRDFQLFMESEATRDQRVSHAISVDGVRGFEMSNTSIHWDDRAPEAAWKSGLALTNVEDFKLHDLSVRQGLIGSTIPAVEIDNSRNGVIRDNQALPQTGQFFLVTGAGTKHLLFLNNDAQNAQSFIQEAGDVSTNEIRITGTIPP